MVLKAYPQENQLVIPADMDKNDYLTMEIKNKTLWLTTFLLIRNEDETFQEPNKKYAFTRVFKKVNTKQYHYKSKR